LPYFTQQDVDKRHAL